mmetsp:Transcript_2138/g.3769  ORF Transcript_2138/g.3769 Transcript_2138/m.3769 type:complete len:190 (-) Transcript_2138:60-629(-)|eukprot:CAMPEP_0182441972 /NCGR_PEP_ID=MMETSP1172-20130603/948_1 /TAXON_ID=708627 /ORGANISM="Timspurckia oligopyrenoides, Strain CCMP3278" /LENGTH=189 /DNA_ID=CAMNT_0024636601 /DNA_START=176 /DNA_END=745 /DNA_ORIENTATION=+
MDGDGLNDGENTRVFVGNLSWETRWQSLKDHMRSAGNVMRAEVFQDGMGRSAGCGICEFETPQDAATAIATLNDSTLDGRQIFVRYDREQASAGPSGQGGYAGGRSEKGRKVVVLNLPYSCRWQELKDIFRSSGATVVRADVMSTPDGRSKGMGTVVFESESDAQLAIGQMNGIEIDGRAIEVRMDRYG